MSDVDSLIDELHAGGFFDDVKGFFSNVFNKGKTVVQNQIKKVDYIKQGYRDAYSPSAAKVLAEYGNVEIKDISVCRQPINQAVQDLLNAVSGNKLKAQQAMLGYDKLFHLYMKVILKNGVVIKLEKNEQITLTANAGNDDYECNYDITVINPLSLNRMLENTLKRIGPTQFWDYNILERNCQIFIKDLLESNREYLEFPDNVIWWFMQPAKQLLATSDTAKQLAVKLPAFKKIFNIVLGIGIKKRKAKNLRKK